MFAITKDQRRALFRLFQRDFPSWTGPRRRISATTGETVAVPSIQWRQFRQSVKPAFGGDCIMIQRWGMWLGIERDGYTHS